MHWQLVYGIDEDSGSEELVMLEIIGWSTALGCQSVQYHPSVDIQLPRDERVVPHRFGVVNWHAINVNPNPYRLFMGAEGNPVSYIRIAAFCDDITEILMSP